MTEPPTTIPSPARLRALYHQLIGLGERNRVPRQDAEELANDVLLTVTEKFDPARGRAETFALFVMNNKIRNFMRDHRLPPAVPYIDEEHADPRTPEDIVTRMEDARMIQETRARLLAALTEEEARFLLEYEAVLDDLDDRAVSETARRLDMTPQQGHNIRQRIERKARKIAARLGGAASATIRGTVRTDMEAIHREVLPEFAVLTRLLSSPSRIPPGEFDITPGISRAGRAFSDEGLGRFLVKLDAASRDRLLSFLS